MPKPALMLERSVSPVARSAALNAICPYFTMFPLDFPLSILSQLAQPGVWVLDPFCGRGTTNYAARLLGLPTIGIDSSPVAAAIAQAKLVHTTPAAIGHAMQRILREVSDPRELPEGEFWSLAFEESVLHTVCRLREGLLRDCRSAARIALRAILLGALHGPRPKHTASYFSNQAPRTYAPKPRYAVNFWRRHGLLPEPVDVQAIIAVRAQRFFGTPTEAVRGRIVLGDSREPGTYAQLPAHEAVRWVIMSPPYYGLRTYIPDQWLRSWLLGGPPSVEYTNEGQLHHGSPEHLIHQLHGVWQQVGAHCTSGATLVVRFGGINDRKADPLTLISESLASSGWHIDAIRPAGAATAGRRQAVHFGRAAPIPLAEHDVWATWGD